MTVVWVAGRLRDAAEPAVSAFDHGLLTGDGVFETTRVYRGEAFALSRHLDRLTHSAATLRLDLPPPAVLRGAVAEVIAANGLAEGRLRITVTGGPGPLGPERGSDGPTVVVAVGPERAWEEATAVVTAPWPRNDRGALAGVKSVSYGENVVAYQHARDRGASEAIFANLAGELCEGTGANVFVARGGRLVTPPLASGCLAGVTRDLVVELVDVVEEPLPLAALAEADEAFLTSSTREVQAIRSVDGAPLPAAPGPLTAAAARALAALIARDLDP